MPPSYFNSSVLRESYLEGLGGDNGVVTTLKIKHFPAVHAGSFPELVIAGVEISSAVVEFVR